MVIFQGFLMLHLSYQIECRFLAMPLSDDSNEAFILTQQQKKSTMNKFELSLAYVLKFSFSYLCENFFFILLVINCISQIYDLYLCYSLVSIILCPLKTWSLVLAFYLRYKCKSLTVNDFYLCIDTSKLKTCTSNVNFKEIDLKNNSKIDDFN